MALTRMETMNNYLDATGDDALGVSDPQSKDVGLPDFTQLKNVYTDGILENAVSNLRTPAADVLYTDNVVEVGDRLLVVKMDDSINPMVVAGVIADTQSVNVVPIMTSNTEPSGEVTGSYGTLNYKIFSGGWATLVTGYITYEFPSATICKGIRIVGQGGTPQALSIHASNDNTTWHTLIVDALPNLSTSVSKYMAFDFINTTAYKYYKMEIETAIDLYFKLEYIEDLTTYEIDTTSVSDGETVTRAYLEEESLTVNEVDLTQREQLLALGTGDTILTKTMYEDTAITPTDNLVVSVGMGHKGNKVQRIGMDAFS